MKTKRIYRMFFNMIQDETAKQAWASLDDDFIAITDGSRMYRLPKVSVPINLAMLKEMQADKLPKLEITDKHQLLQITDTLKDTTLGMPSGYLRKLKAEGFDTWIKNSYLDMFDNPTLYGSAVLDPIIVCEQKKPVGILMPMRMNGGDDE